MRVLVNYQTGSCESVKDLYVMGYTLPVFGNHSVRLKSKLHTGKALGSRKPSIEWYMHTSIYKLASSINAIIHTHSPDNRSQDCSRKPYCGFKQTIRISSSSKYSL